MMEMKKVNSSNIDSVGYDEGTLVVKFRNKHTYEYRDVPYDVYEGMMRAKSIGSTFNATVAKNYEFEVIDGPVVNKSVAGLVEKYTDERSLQLAISTGKIKAGTKVMFIDMHNMWVACVIAKDGVAVHRLGMFWNEEYAVLFLDQINAGSL